MSFVRNRIHTMLRLIGLGVALAVTSIAPARADDAAASLASVVGTWRTAPSSAGRATIRLVAEGDSFYGEIVALDQPLYPPGDAMAGKPRIDRENRDPTLRTRPIIGLRLVEGFRFDDGVWIGGKIYDPDDGRTWSCTLRVEGDEIKLRGYVGISLIGRTTRWSRVQNADPEPAPATSAAKEQI